jgi:hypothetical protein
VREMYFTINVTGAPASCRVSKVLISHQAINF